MCTYPDGRLGRSGKSLSPVPRWREKAVEFDKLDSLRRGKRKRDGGKWPREVNVEARGELEKRGRRKEGGRWHTAKGVKGLYPFPSLRLAMIFDPWFFGGSLDFRSILFFFFLFLRENSSFPRDPIKIRMFLPYFVDHFCWSNIWTIHVKYYFISLCSFHFSWCFS